MDSTADVFERHLKALVAGDVDGLMRDYADDAVIITGPEPIRGRADIEQMFKALAANPPTIIEDLRVVEGDVVYMTWHNDRISFGTDTFVVRDGKIVYQTAGMV